MCINAPAYCSFDPLYTHINFVYGDDPSFKVTCELISLFGSIYRTFSSYQSHINSYQLVSKSLDREDASPFNSGSNNNFTFSYTNDHASEHETTDNNNNNNFQ